MLFLFDIDGTLVRSFMRETPGGDRPEYDLVQVLPGRREKLAELLEAGHRVALVTNQGGVAFGYQTPGQVLAKMERVLDELGLAQNRPWRAQTGPAPYRRREPADVYIAYTHPKAAIARWCVDDGWRKPGPGMLLRAAFDYDVPLDGVLFVGDMDTDATAAVGANVRYEDATSFFGSGDED